MKTNDNRSKLVPEKPKVKKTNKREIVLPEGVTAVFEKDELVVSGKKGQVKRIFFIPFFTFAIDQGKIIITTSKATSRQKKMIGTTMAHIRNMIRGVEKPFIYKLKICSGHFPMTVTVSNNKVIVKNFF